MLRWRLSICELTREEWKLSPREHCVLGFESFLLTKPGGTYILQSTSQFLHVLVQLIDVSLAMYYCLLAKQVFQAGYQRQTLFSVCSENKEPNKKLNSYPMYSQSYLIFFP